MGIVTIIYAVIVMIGIILVYDARLIAKKNFSFNDQNGATLMLKIIGFTMSIVGGFLILL